MKIEGKKAVIAASQHKIFRFLSNFNNYEKLMPEQIVNWKSDQDTCSFTIKGMADLRLTFSRKESPHFLELVPVGKTPVNFTLQVHIEPDTLNEQKSEVSVTVDADLNPMLAMIAKKPFENLANTISGELQKVFTNPQ
jgi:carbon monoxide dehydrogenase subunit G